MIVGNYLIVADLIASKERKITDDKQGNGDMLATSDMGGPGPQLAILTLVLSYAWP